MKHVLSYCYGYELEIDDMNLALEIYKLADKYILDGLKKHCCKHIVDNMNKDNVKDVMPVCLMLGNCSLILVTV